MEKSQGQVTQLLTKAAEGSREALNALLPLVYDGLHARAAACMRKERAGHTLQPTVLVHDAFLQLVDAAGVDWKSRSHFYAFAARSMRQILVMHARAWGAEKRPYKHKRVPLEEGLLVDGGNALDFVALEEALAKLRSYNDRTEKVVEMRFFGGMSTEEVAEVLNVSSKTVKRDWKFARIFLLDELSGGERERRSKEESS